MPSASAHSGVGDRLRIDAMNDESRVHEDPVAHAGERSHIFGRRLEKLQARGSNHVEE